MSKYNPGEVIELLDDDDDEVPPKPVEEKRSLDEMNDHIQQVLTQMRDKFHSMSEQILAKIDDMGTRIDELEKNICELMTHAGIEIPDK